MKTELIVEAIEELIEAKVAVILSDRENREYGASPYMHDEVDRRKSRLADLLETEKPTEFPIDRYFV